MAVRHSDPNVELGINKLLEIGVLSEQGLETLGKMVRSLQAFGGSPPVHDRTDGTAGPLRARRRRRGKLTISEADLRKLYAGNSAKTIAEQHGVSVATVSNRLREYGISKQTRRTAKKTAKASKRVAKQTRKASKKRAKTSSRKTKKKASSKKSKRKAT